MEEREGTRLLFLEACFRQKKSTGSGMAVCLCSRKSKQPTEAGTE